MKWRTWSLLVIALSLGYLAFGYRHALLEWWRFDRFGQAQPITQEQYEKLGASIEPVNYPDSWAFSYFYACTETAMRLRAE